MLRFEKLSKRYGDHVIFKGLHYAAGNGCVALCDENGSGKSTLLGILAGMIDADEGEVWLDGQSLRTAPFEAKSALAYVPEDYLEHPAQTGREFLDLVASTRKTAVDSAVLDLADRFGLSPHLEKRFEQMSLGTRKKFLLSATIIGNPRVVIVDEPVNGIDAAGRAILVELFTTLAAERTIFFASHDLKFARACEAKMVNFADLAA